MRVIILILIMNFIMLLPLAAEILTLESAREIALQDNPALLSAERKFKAADWSKWQSFSSLLPAASITGAYTEYDPALMGAEDSRSYGYTITQPLFNGGAIWLGYRIKRDQAKIESANYDNQRLKTIADLETKYYSVLENQNLLAIAEKDLLASELHLDIARARYEAGTLSRADYLQMQSQKASKEVNLLQMENLVKISRLDLANFLQIDTDFDLEQIDPGTSVKQLQIFQELSTDKIKSLTSRIIEFGLEQNPTLKIAEASRAIAGKSLWMAGGNMLPSLNLSYSKTWTKNDFDEEYEDSGRLMLTASLPVFPLLDKSANIAKAHHENKRALYDQNAALDGIELALESSFLTLVTAAKTVEAARLTLEYARETFEQVEERYRNNIVSTSDLLDVEILLTSSENQYITSFYKFLKARSELLLQMGTEDERVLINLITLNNQEDDE